MSLIKWSPERELMRLDREFSRIFDFFNNRFDRRDDQKIDNAVWSPFTDIVEDDDQYTLKLDLPGIKKDDVKISYNDGALTVSSERKEEVEEKNKKYHRIERAYGNYYRSFTLPTKVKEDKITAEFTDGILTIKVPKAEEAKPREIEIKVK